MIAKAMKGLLIVAFLAGYAAMRPAACEAWSLLHPFTPNAPAQKPIVRTVQKPPSTWDKVVAGPKNLWNKTGEKLGLKKPEKKPIPQYAYPKPPVLQKRQPESKSWLGSWFKPKEPDKPRNVEEWMGATSQVRP